MLLLLAPGVGMGASASTASDTTPDAFEFVDLAGQQPGRGVESNIITIAGIDTSATVTFSESGHLSGFYSKNGGEWTDLASTTVDNGDTLQLKLTAAPSGSISILVTIGGVSDTWSVETRNPGGFLSVAERQRIQAEKEDEEIMKIIIAFLEDQ